MNFNTSGARSIGYVNTLVAYECAIIRQSPLIDISDPVPPRRLIPRAEFLIGVAGTGVRSAMPGARIRETRRLVGADRNISKAIDHEVMHTLVSFQACLRIEITKSRDATINI
jgi:hypothetical protein